MKKLIIIIFCLLFVVGCITPLQTSLSVQHYIDPINCPKRDPGKITYPGPYFQDATIYQHQLCWDLYGNCAYYNNFWEACAVEVDKETCLELGGRWHSIPGHIGGKCTAPLKGDMP